MTDFWCGRRTLVTGCAGFVGSNLSRRLWELGAEVTGLDRVNDSPSLRILEVSIPIWMADISDPAQIRGIVSHLAPEVVFHLAGASHISACQRDPLVAWEANVRGTWSVLEACRHLPTGQIRAVVCASSNHVYGSLPIKLDSTKRAWLENDPCGQPDVYGTSKGMVDLLVRSYGAMGLPTAGLRHVNCHGPADPYRSHIVIATICDLLEGKAPTIKSDGTPVKAYLHVDDVVQAYLLIAAQIAGGNAHLVGRSLNAGGVPISVLALVDILIQLSGLNVVPEITGEDMTQSGYVEILDDSTLRGLGWTPVHAGLERTFDWYKERRGMAWLLP